MVFGTLQGLLHAYALDGTPLRGFPLKTGGSVTSKVGLGLIGKAPVPALVSGNEDGKVYAVDASGALRPGFPVPTQYMVTGQPAIADLDGDGSNDVAFASQDAKLYAVRTDGTPLPGFPLSAGARLYGGPAVADLDGDGKLELVVGVSDGRVHAVGANGAPVKGFPVKLGEKLSGAAVTADLDRDGKDEILVAVDGQLHVLKGNGRALAGFPAKLSGEPASGPSVAEGIDGALVIAVGAGEQLFAFKLKPTGKAAPLSWPEPGHDAARSGRRQPNPPGYADLKIAPGAPRTADALTATWRYFDLDGDPEQPVEIRWFRDGKEVPELLNKKEVAPEFTKKHQKWRFELEGRWKSPELTIANTPPGVPKLALAQPLRRAEPVRSSIAEEAKDPDGDALTYRYVWLKNGAIQKEHTKAEIPAGAVKRGDRWSVAVTAFDGEAAGSPTSVEAVVVDSPPTAPEIALEPANPRRGDTVKAVLRKPATDVDGDKLTYRYRFSLDGVPLPFASSVDQVPPLTARKKQVLTVEVLADDGELTGPAATATATYVNTPPQPPRPTLSPADPRKGDTVTAGLAALAEDIDDDKLSYRFAFVQGGNRVEGRELPAGRRGEVIEVEAVANDGEADSAPARARVEVRNSPPGAPVIALSAERPRAGEPVEVRVETPSVDPDGDAIRYRHAWSVGGKPVPGDAPQLPGRTKKGEIWTVEVTPLDDKEAGRSARAQLFVQNNVPGAPQVALEPAEPTAVTGVKAKLTAPAADADGDKLAYRYQWFRNGVRLELPADTAALAPGTLVRGDAVRVLVSA
ncbi:MAG: FG-GAP-like repeat-containing protein, partial [Myxococcales bacterium]